LEEKLHYYSLRACLRTGIYECDTGNVIVVGGEGAVDLLAKEVDLIEAVGGAV